MFYRLPIVAGGDSVRWITEILENESSSIQRVVFSRYDVAELETLIRPGSFVDAIFSLDLSSQETN
ncbi:hypothetical protein HanHA300_Chr10g0367771 [Helianthus annuus]|nr:hypothetical protein HanHA300_Chr10g0367771 [Helianthus annuus]KAJ0522405.1 hypothetical protein HanIR_Chr10g0482291 [Helianthus annuus]KAJ0530417.1 hypothetical protein HanHA89_Chr10g0389651 [Helianthus annuus]KAJ0697267.1 hypothetical protein HanLR1_Chr10g0367091 [Helianthus annuus]